MGEERFSVWKIVSPDADTHERPYAVAVAAETALTLDVAATFETEDDALEEAVRLNDRIGLPAG